MLRSVSVGLVVLLVASTAFGVTGESQAGWKADLAVLRDELPKLHRNLFHDVTREEFHRLLTSLESELPKLSDDQVAVRVAEIVTLMAGDRDGHSGAALWNRFHLLPINFFLYSDGLYVRGASKEYASLAGARVTTIGGTSAEEVLRRVQPGVAGDNDMSRKADAVLRIAMPELLRALRVAPGEPNAPVEIAGVFPDGRKVSLSVTGLRKMDDLEWVDVRRQAPQLPLYLRHADPSPFRWYAPAKALWYEYLPQQKALYVHYGAVADGPDETVAAFFERVFAFADANPVEKFIVDLRHNGGGNNFLNRPFLHGMIKRDATINRSGRFFVLIGRHTFSAAQNIVTQLERETNVMFAGEPTGGAPNHYGDATRLTLPNSKLVVRASTLWWQDAHPNDERLWIAPHIAAELSSADDRAGRDPALEAVLSFTPEPSLAELLRTAIARGGKPEAAALYAKWRSDPRRKYLSPEREVTQLGIALFSEKQLEQALVAFEINAEAWPQSWRAQEALGRAYQTLERIDEAVAAYRRAVALSDKAVLSRERLGQLKRPSS